MYRHFPRRGLGSLAGVNVRGLSGLESVAGGNVRGLGGTCYRAARTQVEGLDTTYRCHYLVPPATSTHLRVPLKAQSRGSGIRLGTDCGITP